jgi:hypothetical protein
MGDIADLNTKDARLTKIYWLHRGVTARVARWNGVDPSYVTRIIAGQRNNPKILTAVLIELRRIQAIK